MQDNTRWIKTHCGRLDHGGCALVCLMAISGNLDIPGGNINPMILKQPHLENLSEPTGSLQKERNGTISQIAHLADAIHPRVINAAYGWWFPEAKPQSQYDWKTSNFNMLTSMETLGTAFRTPNLKGIGCRIRSK